MTRSELLDQARALATSTRQFPQRSDTYRLLGGLGATVSALEQVCSQLSGFHSAAQDGVDYDGEDGGGSGQSAQEATAALNEARIALAAAGRAIDKAREASSHIVWR